MSKELQVKLMVELVYVTGSNDPVGISYIDPKTGIRVQRNLKPLHDSIEGRVTRPNWGTGESSRPRA